MEANVQERIAKTVLRILEESDMEEMTEHEIRKQAATELHLDLSQPPYTAFVKQVVQSFLEQQQQDHVETNKKKKRKNKESKEETGATVSFQSFTIFTSIFLSGISLTEEQWSAFKKTMPAIEKAIKKMESKLL